MQPARQTAERGAHRNQTGAPIGKIGKKIYMRRDGTRPCNVVRFTRLVDGGPVGHKSRAHRDLWLSRSGPTERRESRRTTTE